MTSKAKWRANQRNAQFSTGPVSAAGKKRCAKNAWVHGLSQALQVKDLDEKHQEMAVTLQQAGYSAGQSATMALAMQDFQRAKGYRATIDPVRYQRRALKQLRQVLATKVLPFVFILFLPACVPFGLYQNAYNAGVDYFNPKPFIVTDAIKNSPYAMQLVRYKNYNAVMVLAYVDDGARLSWVDSEGNGFTTLEGKIISSHGLDNDLEIMDPPKVRDIFLRMLNEDYGQSSFNSLFRLSAPPTAYLEMQHVFKIIERKQQSIKRQIDQGEVLVSLIEEQIYVPAIKWEASNFYWVDEEGNVVKSKQALAPNTEKYFLETLKSFKPTN